MIQSDSVAANICPSISRRLGVHRPLEIFIITKRDTHFPTAMIATIYAVEGAVVWKRGVVVRSGKVTDQNLELLCAKLIR
jgi:hypothetical protein